MHTHIAILRGINVGGQKKILMTDLKDIFIAQGFENVETYIQSGNVVFSTNTHKDNQLLAVNLEKAIQAKYQFHVPVIVRSNKEWEVIVLNNPFVGREGLHHDKLHVTFLSEEPNSIQLEQIKKYQYLPDEYVIAGKEIYLHCPIDYGHSKLSNNFFESKLKVKATTRNWKTTLKLFEMLSLND